MTSSAPTAEAVPMSTFGSANFPVLQYIDGGGVDLSLSRMPSSHLEGMCLHLDANDA